MVFGPTREESSGLVRGLLFRKAAENWDHAWSKVKENGKRRGVIDLTPSRQLSLKGKGRELWEEWEGHPFAISLSPTSDYKMAFQFTVRSSVIELLRLTTMEILLNAVPPFRRVNHDNF